MKHLVVELTCASGERGLRTFPIEDGGLGTRYPTAVATTIMNCAEQMFPQPTAAQIARVASIGHRRDVRAGELLFDVGDQNTRFFVVLSAAIEIVRPIGDGEEPVIVHHAGEFTGEINVLSARRSLVRARTAGDGAVMRRTNGFAPPACPLLSPIGARSSLSGFTCSSVSVIAAVVSSYALLAARLRRDVRRPR